MRNKIIAVNAAIVLIVGFLSWAMMRSALATAADNDALVTTQAKHAAFGASAKLQVDALRAELWVSERAAEAATSDAIAKGTVDAQREGARERCNALAAQAQTSGFFESVPSLVALVDASGKILGRNGTLQYGDNLAAVYEGIGGALKSGHSGSDIWVAKARSDQYLASYAPFRDAQGGVAGALVIGMTLNDELSRVSDATIGSPVVLVDGTKGELAIVAHSTVSSQGLEADITSVAKDAIVNALQSGHATSVRAHDIIVAISPVLGLGSARRAALVGSRSAVLFENATGMANPVLGAMALGLVLVIVAGWLLGNYISRPIDVLEEGLLAILNGQTDRRFDMDHAELGGLAFRIDNLLNQLMGVEEDTTDAEGRVSHAPSQKNFSAAMSVDDRKSGAALDQSEPGIDPAVVRRLAAEPEADYYARIFREYIAAKKALGEATDQITQQTFVARIQEMEKDAAGKVGKQVRYQVASNGREVSLLAIPLP